MIIPSRLREEQACQDHHHIICICRCIYCAANILYQYYYYYGPFCRRCGVFVTASPVSIHATHLSRSTFFCPPSFRVPLFHAIGDMYIPARHGTKNDPQLSKKTHTKIREKKWSGFKLTFSTLVGQMVDFLIKKKQLLDIKYKMGTLRHVDMSTTSWIADHRMPTG